MKTAVQIAQEINYMRGRRMTRKEAIANLNILKDDYWDDDGYGHETEKYDDTMLSLDMAIGSLEQEPQIRPKGHWIKTNDYFTGAYESIDYVECSCCHADSLEEGNYCPNCGAEMESEDKE